MQKKECPCYAGGCACLGIAIVGTGDDKLFNKESPEGQTHSQNDGCDYRAHNRMSVEEKYSSKK